LFQRLVGLETEYAIRYRPAETSAPLSRFRLYQRLTAAVRQHVLTVRAHHFKEGIFTANGGAVWFEAERPAAGAGLIEGATPECRGARQALIYQRAQDFLLSQSARGAAVAGHFQLVKNDRDAKGNVYGAQENYEAEIGRGLSLFGWRAGLVLLVPFVLVYWIIFFLMIALLLAYFAAVGIIYLISQWFVSDRRKLAIYLFGLDCVEGQETGAPTPVWLEALVLNLTRIISAPLAIALLMHCRFFAFRQLRQKLTPFLISRCVLSGAGMVDKDNQFQLSDKASALNCLVGFGGFLHDRPLFTMGHFFKSLCAECLTSLRTYANLFASRQRLQIGLGDSNMCETAEYLRIGTTLLVLDAIEAGALPRMHTVRRPLRALKQLCSDPTLRAEVQLSSGQRVTALELQRFYLEACRRYIDFHPDPPADALDVLQRWEECLEALVEYKQNLEYGLTSDGSERLVGVLDWVTKRFILQRLDATADWAQRKKVDIRYHELSPQGYFEKLKAAGMTVQLVSDAELERAVRLPPPNSPATTRGHYIREFADADEIVGVNWHCVWIGRGRRSRTIQLNDYGTTKSPRNEFDSASDSKVKRRRL